MLMQQLSSLPTGYSYMAESNIQKFFFLFLVFNVKAFDPKKEMLKQYTKLDRPKMSLLIHSTFLKRISFYNYRLRLLHILLLLYESSPLTKMNLYLF